MIYLMILSIWTDIQDFFRPITDFFTDLWNSIRDFLLQYMSQDVLSVLVFGIVVAIILIIVLAIMNRN